MMMSTTCFAGGIDVVPSLNDAPVFWGMLNNDPKYHDAAFKAQQAFLIQSGIQRQYDMVKNYVSGQVDKVAKVAEHEAVAVIENNTPLKATQVFFVIGAGYTIAVKKEITQRFRNPLFKNVRHSITLGQERQMIGAEIPF